MAKTKAEKSENKKQTITHSGVMIEGEVVTGEDPKITPQEQGRKARGEDKDAPKKELKGSTRGAEAKNAARTDKEKATDILIEERNEAMEEAGEPVQGVRMVKTDETLYQGVISAKAKAAATGEDISLRWNQAQPTTEEGLFYSFRTHHPSAIRDTFEFDVKNELDPTLRTHLEK